MTIYEPGEIVVVRFPFTNLKSIKKRPVLIISPTKYQSKHGDVLVIALTSKEKGAKQKIKEWQKAGLGKPTWVKATIFTLTSKILVKKVGVLQKKDYSSVTTAINQLIYQHFI